MYYTKIKLYHESVYMFYIITELRLFIKTATLNLYYNFFFQENSSDSSLIQQDSNWFSAFVHSGQNKQKSFRHIMLSASGMFCFLSGEFLELPVVFFQHLIHFSWLSQQWTRHVHFVIPSIILYVKTT